MEIVYMIPLLITQSCEDMVMAMECFESLERIENIQLVIYNQGYLTNKQLKIFMEDYNIGVHILGEGSNVGITKARHECLEYIWKTWPDTKYIAEAHVDMVFTPNWDKPLIAFMERTGEPMVCPRILIFEEGQYKTNFSDQTFDFSKNLNERIKLLESLQEHRVEEKFVHPVIHNASVLKEIHPYDVRFLTGHQGYEDDSIVLGYNYYQGTKMKWRPKMYMGSCVYHKTLAQRMGLPNLFQEFSKNYEGIKMQYGAYGFESLARIHNSTIFEDDFRKCVMDS